MFFVHSSIAKIKTLFCIAGIQFFAFCCVEAKLVAHYDFSDGDLLDNEVGPALSLTNPGKLSVTLRNGAAVFASSKRIRGPQNYLLMDTEQNFKKFTVSFWFRTKVVDQDHQFGGIFSSRHLADPFSFQFFSAGQAIENNNFNGNGATLIRANSEKNQVNSERFNLHQANTWYHVGLVYDGRDLVITISSLGGYFGDLARDSVFTHELQLDHFLFGNNRGLTQGYGFELADVKIYNSVEPLKSLYDDFEEPGAYVDIPEPASFALILSALTLTLGLSRRRERRLVC